MSVWIATTGHWCRGPGGASPTEDENPGIENWIGRGDATLVHQRNGHGFALMARHWLQGGDDSRSAVQFDGAFPVNITLRGHVQVFDGYAESLVD